MSMLDHPQQKKLQIFATRELKLTAIEKTAPENMWQPPPTQQPNRNWIATTISHNALMPTFLIPKENGNCPCGRQSWRCLRLSSSGSPSGRTSSLMLLSRQQIKNWKAKWPSKISTPGLVASSSWPALRMLLTTKTGGQGSQSTSKTVHLFDSISISKNVLPSNHFSNHLH